MKNRFYRTIDTINSMRNPSWKGAHLFGAIDITTEFKEFVSDYEYDLDIELMDHEKRSITTRNIDSYSSINIKFIPPRTEIEFIAKDVEDYLEYYNFKHQSAKKIFLTDSRNILDNKTVSGETLENYLSVLNLLSFIESVSDHSSVKNSTKNYLIFYGTEKISITSEYNSETLASVNNLKDVVGEIAKSINSAPHKDTKKSLIKKAIIDIVKSEPESKRLEKLISEIVKIKNNFTSNYEIFISEFSFDTEKEKLDEQKQSYIIKINELLSGIHGKLFAVPASVIIVAGQMKSPSEPDYELANSIILIGSLLFSLFMWMLTANQLHSLRTIEDDFDNKENRIRSTLKQSLYNEVESAFKDIKSRIKFQRNMIRLIDTLVLLSLISSLAIYEYHCQILASSF